jgi:uncharacterized membrane protein
MKRAPSGPLSGFRPFPPLGNGAFFMDVDPRNESSGAPFAARGPLLAVLVFALLGVAFSGVSTYDFVEHLDRQVHSIHCSFIPGAGSELGESGCRTVMLSPYSSFFRESMWGGIPVALWSLAVFAFLAWRAGTLLWRREAKKVDTLFLVAAFALPVLMSVIYGYLAMAKVEAVCKVCVGIYLASFGGLATAIWAHLRAPSAEAPDLAGRFVKGIGGGVAFVVLLSLLYMAMAPKAEVKGCGQLVRDDDPSGIMLALSPAAGNVPAVEVIDPLCPSCKAFEKRLLASDLKDRLDVRAVLFPLDPSCNWMVKDALHPGACAVSEAVLCAGPLSKDGADKVRAGEKAAAVLAYAYAHQEEIRAEAKNDENVVRARLEREFPEVKGCMGSALVKNRLVKSLRWAVANAIPVLTPQLFVGKTRLCDEDTDLGLEYTLAKMLDGGAAAPAPTPAAAPVAKEATR